MEIAGYSPPQASLTFPSVKFPIPIHLFHCWYGECLYPTYCVWCWDKFISITRVSIPKTNCAIIPAQPKVCHLVTIQYFRRILFHLVPTVFCIWDDYSLGVSLCSNLDPDTRCLLVRSLSEEYVGLFACLYLEVKWRLGGKQPDLVKVWYLHGMDGVDISYGHRTTERLINRFSMTRSLYGHVIYLSLF